MTIHIRLTDSSIYKDRTELGLQFAHVINAELRELVEAGATYIQLDEPAAAIVEGELQDSIGLLNVALDGLAVRRCLHVCFGNLLSWPRGKREYSRLLPLLSTVNVEELSLEFANRDSAPTDYFKILTAGFSRPSTSPG